MSMVDANTRCVNPYYQEIPLRRFRASDTFAEPSKRRYICPALSSQAPPSTQLLCLAGVVRQKTKRQKGTEKRCHVTSRYVL